MNSATYSRPLRHAVVCLPNSAQSCQKVITPELDFLHGNNLPREHFGPGVQIFSNCFSSVTAKPMRQTSRLPSITNRNGHFLEQKPSSGGGIVTDMSNLRFSRLSRRAPQHGHSHIVKYFFPSIVGILKPPAANNTLQRTATVAELCR